MKKIRIFIVACILSTAVSCKTTETHVLSVKEATNRTIKLLSTAQNKTAWQQVQLINDWVNNSIKQSDDVAIWGKRDFWASPLEVIAKAAGDCEDYAVTKYLLLREIGIPSEQLFLSHVDYEYQNAPHMVLIYFNHSDHGYYVLDNIITHVKPSQIRRDLTYKFSFNESTVFAGSPPELTPIRGSHPSQISNWMQVISKWNVERLRLSTHEQQ